MKKIITIIISLFIIFSTSGCTETVNNVITDINGIEKTSFTINETAIYEDVHYTVTNVEYSNGNDWDKPSEGKNYVIVTIKIENKSNEKISYNGLDWTMLNSEGQEDSKTFSTIDSDTNLGSGDLASGGSKTGTLVFEENKSDTSLKLLYYNNMFFDENHTIEFILK